MRSVLSDISRLEDILEAIEFLESCAITSHSTKKDVYAACYSIGIIGEASNKLSQEVTQTYRDVPWRQLINMRNVVIHEYDGIHLPTVVDIVDDDIPLLKKQIQTILSTLTKDQA